MYCFLTKNQVVAKSKCFCLSLLKKIQKMIPKEIPIDEALILRQKVLWPHKNLDFVKTPTDSKGVHFGINVVGKWISCISLFMEKEGRAQFRKFATLPEFQGNGYGSQLLNHSFDFLKEKKIKTVYCSARTEKQDFYKKFGMQPAGEIYEKNGLQYIQMQKTFIYP